MASFLKIGSKGPSPLDVGALAGLVAATQQNDNDLTSLSEVYTIARPVVDTRLRDAAAETFAISDVSTFETADARHDPSRCPTVAQTAEPVIEGR